MRLQAAFRLALDLDTCRALLAGHMVDPSRIDPDGLRWAREKRMVQLRAPVETLLAA
jgi:hypothetical protein